MDCFQEDAKKMPLWRGKNTTSDRFGDRRGRKPALTPAEQLFDVLARLRVGLLKEDLAYGLVVSVSVMNKLLI